MPSSDRRQHRAFIEHPTAEKVTPEQRHALMVRRLSGETLTARDDEIVRVLDAAGRWPLRPE